MQEPGGHQVTGFFCPCGRGGCCGLPAELDLTLRYRVQDYDMEKTDGNLLIGELARRAGLRLTTVRFYERRGLLPEPDRTAAGYRRYSAADVDRLRFIQRAKDLGFSLQEIAGLLALNGDPAADCEQIRKTAAAKIATVDTRIERLRRMRTALLQLMEQCPGEGTSLNCPILSALNDNAEG